MLKKLTFISALGLFILTIITANTNPPKGTYLDDPMNSNLKGKKVLITATSLRVRKEPHTNAEVVFKVKLGDLVTVLSEGKDYYQIGNMRNRWTKIIYGGNKTGYIFAEFIGYPYLIEGDNYYYIKRTVEHVKIGGGRDCYVPVLGYTRGKEDVFTQINFVDSSRLSSRTIDPKSLKWITLNNKKFISIEGYRRSISHKAMGWPGLPSKYEDQYIYSFDGAKWNKALEITPKISFDYMVYEWAELKELNKNQVQIIRYRIPNFIKNEDFIQLQAKLDEKEQKFLSLTYIHSPKIVLETKYEQLKNKLNDAQKELINQSYTYFYNDYYFLNDYFSTNPDTKSEDSDIISTLFAKNEITMDLTLIPKYSELTEKDKLKIAQLIKKSAFFTTEIDEQQTFSLSKGVYQLK